MPPADILPTAVPHPLLGTLLRETYLIRRLIDAEDGIFEAAHPRVSSPLRVKVIEERFRADGHAIAALRARADVLREIEHPNLVGLLDFGVTNEGDPYWVMEPCSGRTLADMLLERGELQFPFVARAIAQAARGLAAAHAAGEFHGTLRPARLLFDAGEPEPGVKVLELGLPATAEPRYLAPERVTGARTPPDAPSDQYSLAVVAYEAVAGHCPFPGDNASELLERVIANEPMPLARFAPQAPRALGNVLRRAMLKNPKSRFGSVVEFAKALLSAAGVADDLATEDREEQRERTSSLRPLDLSELLSRAREAFGLGDLDLAVSYVESALALAERNGAPQDPSLERSTVLIEAILRTRLGSSGERLRARKPPHRVALSPEQAFLLSRIGDGASVEDVLDLSPLERRVTLRHLLTLLRRGALGLA